jgi:hypothetical protein
MMEGEGRGLFLPSCREQRQPIAGLKLRPKLLERNLFGSKSLAETAKAFVRNNSS